MTLIFYKYPTIKWFIVNFLSIQQTAMFKWRDFSQINAEYFYFHCMYSNKQFHWLAEIFFSNINFELFVVL